jgi:hypothetical protein
VYGKRIQRGDEFFSLRKLGAFGADLAAMAQFFDLPLSRPVAALTAGAQAFLLNMAGSCLQALGRLREAVGTMQAGLQANIAQAQASIAQKYWEGAAIPASNLSELFLTLGDIAQA